MIGWLRRRADARIDRHAALILNALGDGHAHYIVGDLDTATGIPAGAMWPALTRLELDGWAESGRVDTGPGRRRRWYRLTQQDTT